jgi:hypothetical protein
MSLDGSSLSACEMARDKNIRMQFIRLDAQSIQANLFHSRNHVGTAAAIDLLYG